MICGGISNEKTNDHYNGSISPFSNLSFSLVTTETLKLIIGLFPLTNVYDIWVNAERAGKAMHK